ncbi:MAG: hypothetical protein HYU64_17985 [Armatimonadetes bacterium]|nr:hypothetical protein [Armatimonadota bacterium]
MLEYTSINLVRGLSKHFPVIAKGFSSFSPYSSCLFLAPAPYTVKTLFVVSTIADTIEEGLQISPHLEPTTIKVLTLNLSEDLQRDSTEGTDSIGELKTNFL